MPKIPTTDAPDARPAGAPDVGIHVNAQGAFGQAYGQAYDALNQAGGQLAAEAVNKYREQYRKAQDAAVTNGQTKLQESATDLGHNPDYGLYNRRGEDAINASEDFYAALSLKRQQIQDSLSGEEAKREFALRSGQMMAAHRDEVEKFVSGQVEQVHKDTLVLANASGLDAARKDPANDAVATASYYNMSTAVEQLAGSNEEKATLRAGMQKDLTATRIQALLEPVGRDGAPLPPRWEEAKRIFDKAGDTLGKEQPEFAQKIYQAQAGVSADSLAQKFVGAHLDNGRPILGAIQAEVDKLPAGPFREKVQDQVNLRQAHTMAAWEQVEGDRLHRVNIATETSGGYLNEASDDYGKLSPKGKDLALERRDAILHREPRRPTPQSTGALIALSTDIEKNPLKYKGMTPQQFTTMAVQSGAGDQDLRKLGEKFASAQKAKDYVLPVASTVNELFQHAFNLPKTRPDTWAADKQELWRDVHDHVEKEANTFIRKHNGALPNDAELEKFANDRLVKGSVTGGGRFYGDANNVTRVEAEHNSRYAGKPFVPSGGARAPTQAPQLPAGAKRGTDGRLYQKTPSGKWAAIDG